MRERGRHLSLEDGGELRGRGDGDVVVGDGLLGPGLGVVAETDELETVGVTLGRALAGHGVSALTLRDEELTAGSTEGLAASGLESELCVTKVDLENGRVVGLDGVGEGTVSVDGGADDLGAGTVHAEELDFLAVGDVGLGEEGLDGGLAVVEDEGELLIKLDGLDESLESGHVDDVDLLVGDDDAGALGAGLDLGEVELAESTLGSDHVDGHGSHGGTDWASVGDTGLDAHDEGAEASKLAN